jgi:hypothetical protein
MRRGAADEMRARINIYRYGVRVLCTISTILILGVIIFLTHHH